MDSIVFYQPIYDPKKRDTNSGTVIRPRCMKNAFSQLGYHVIDINGSFDERKSKTEAAVTCDMPPKLVYCESANTPFCFSGKNHLDIRMMSDFHNLKRLKRVAKLGFYYRDIFWAEKTYYKEFGRIKGRILKALFRYEYKKLIDLVDVFYVQSDEMKREFPYHEEYKEKFKLLPPGCEDRNLDFFGKSGNAINILYSGACDNNTKYNVSPLFDILRHNNACTLTINSAKGESIYGDLRQDKALHNRLFFRNLDYDHMDQYDQKFTAGLVWLSGNNEDIKKYLPIKVFYYLSMGLPIIAMDHTAAGRYVTENHIGWTYKDIDDLNRLLEEIKQSESDAEKMHARLLEFRKTQMWINRAKYVEETLLQ